LTSSECDWLELKYFEIEINYHTLLIVVYTEGSGRADTMEVHAEYTVGPL